MATNNAGKVSVKERNTDKGYIKGQGTKTVMINPHANAKHPDMPDKVNRRSYGTKSQFSR